jgi:hypothetical protein
MSLDTATSGVGSRQNGLRGLGRTARYSREHAFPRQTDWMLYMILRAFEAARLAGLCAAAFAALAICPAMAQEATETATIGPVSLDDPGIYPTPELLGTFNFAGNVLVFTCNVGDACWGSDTETPWSYTFTQADLAALESGSADFSVIQTGIGNVQADTTTLSLDVYVPEPASIAVFGASLLGLGLILRRTRA